jgi:hypothetical protein
LRFAISPALLCGLPSEESKSEGRNQELHLILSFRYWRAIRVYQ